MFGLGLARGLVVVEPAVVGLVPCHRPPWRDGGLVLLLLPLPMLLLLVRVTVAVGASSVLLTRVSVTVLARGAVALLGGCSVGLLLTAIAGLRASMLLLMGVAVAGGGSSVA